MRNIIFGVMFIVASLTANMATAQQSVWVQIEAQRSLARAQQVARNYSANLQQVAGFVMQSGWYAIAIGPFGPAEAENVLQQLRVTRQIPGDSYVVDGSNFRRQFWPIGANTGSATTSEAPSVEPVQVGPAVPPKPATETVAQARQSERQLSREERMLLQTALKSEGLYLSTIDGAIGPGTRGSMSAWQQRYGYEDTGVLTTNQRRELIEAYHRLLASLGMSAITDSTVGMQIELPLEMVRFDRYDPPFAHFVPKNDSGVRVLLISQTGDDATLRGLYDIMQTLEIVPLEGPRSFGRRSFTLTGQNDQIASYTFAELSNGHVKGFSLIWDQPLDRRRDIVVNSMRSSYAAFGDAVLPDVYGNPDAAQSLDLLAGLVIRQPDHTGSGFYVDQSGSIITDAQTVQSCERIVIDDDFTAEIATLDKVRGLALLRPSLAVSPIAVAQLATGSPRLNSEIAVAGYSYGGVLGAPTLTYGNLSDLRGLNGEKNINRLAISVSPGDAGGPVLGQNGAVLGMLLPADRNGTRKLPDGVNFAADTSGLQEFLDVHDVPYQTAENFQAMDPEDLNIAAANMTVLVSCWN